MTTTSSFRNRDSSSMPHSTLCITPHLPRKRAALGTNSDPTAPPIQAHRPPRLIPSQWLKLEPANHSYQFPDVYIAPSHSRVPPSHGNIYVIVISTDPEDLHKTFAHGASLSSFCSLEEAAAKGMPALRPSLNDFLVFHDKYGREEDGDSKDAVKSWSHAKKEFPTPVLENLQKLQDDIYGKEELMSDSKAVAIDGKFCGGIAIERTFHSRFHVRNAQSNEGLCKGAPDVPRIMAKWADLANFPKTGGYDRYAGFSSSVNNCWPASQMNLASARRAEIHAEGTAERSSPTGEAMMTLMRPHPDVPEECFCLMEFGIVWVLEEFCTLYFSGLHMHGRGLAQYGPLHTDDSIYTCVIIILYPPQVILNRESALTFAALPYPPDPCRACQKRARKECWVPKDMENTPDDDEDRDEDEDKDLSENSAKVPQKCNPLKTALLKLPMEWCRRGIHQLSLGRYYTEQATYVSDGGSFLAPKDHFNHSVCSLLQWIHGIIQQFPPHYFVHYDKDLLLSMFSMELEGVWLAAEPWDLGLGWTGDDVQIGSKSDVSIESMTPQQIAQRWNTNDCANLAPYGNANIAKVEEAFYTLAEETG
ncbi:hypothetical protein F5146DRAFT_1004367 [Armillaria mellea]|nr:hypothetical protein F5146DRAFT_1004367 [Armillaria mellea]